jgi:hypothetical protein
MIRGYRSVRTAHEPAVAIVSCVVRTPRPPIDQPAEDFA